jgi:SOS response regulatory protein OraA/RecX
MEFSPRMLNILRWLGVAEAALAVGLGLAGEELLFLPPRVRPLLMALVGAGVAFGAYSWFSARKRLVPVVTAGALSIVAVNSLISVAWGPRYAATLEPDMETIYRLIPGAEKLSRNPDGEWIRRRVNSRGFRGPEFEQGSAATRVVVYGDSFVEADFSPLEATFVAQFGNQLSRRLQEPVQAINAGVNGYGPDQSLRRMQRDLPALRPRLTLLVLFAGNDFGDLIRNRLYRIGPGGALQESAFTWSPRLIRDFEGSRRRPILLNLLESAWRQWRSRRLIPDTARDILNARKLEYDNFAAGGNSEIDNIGTDSSDLDLAADLSGPTASHKIHLMERVLARCARVAADNDSAFAVVIVGRADDLAGDPLLGAAEFPRYRPSNLTDLLEFIAGRQQIPCINTYAAFQRAGADAVYFLAHRDHHWNEAGQRLAAELVAEFVTAGDSPLMEPSARAERH